MICLKMSYFLQKNGKTFQLPGTLLPYPDAYGSWGLRHRDGAVSQKSVRNRTTLHTFACIPHCTAKFLQKAKPLPCRKILNRICAATYFLTGNLSIVLGHWTGNTII